MGVARVNGDLAVSRAFGDAQHKQTGGPGQAQTRHFTGVGGRFVGGPGNFSPAKQESPKGGFL